MENIISEKRQMLIDEKNASPLQIGETISVGYNSVNYGFIDKKRSNESISCIIMAIGENITVRRSDDSVHKKKYNISVGEITGRDISRLGANPFDESVDSVRPIAFPLDSILFGLGILGNKGRIESPYFFDGVQCMELNWNPYIYNSKGEKEYYQRGFVWSLRDNQLLIESLYQGIDCGKILVRKRGWKEIEKMRANGETELAFTDIVDGKQRLNCIRGFIKGEFPDMHGNYYGDLSFSAQHKLTNNQQFSYAEMPENSKDRDVIKQFLKMNFTGVPQSIEHIEFVKSLQNS